MAEATANSTLANSKIVVDDAMAQFPIKNKNPYHHLRKISFMLTFYVVCVLGCIQKSESEKQDPPGS